VELDKPHPDKITAERHGHFTSARGHRECSHRRILPQEIIIGDLDAASEYLSEVAYCPSGIFFQQE